MDNEKLTIETNDVKTVQQDNELENKETRKKSKPQRTFPQYSIEECLTIAKSIAENNSGNPWEPEQVAASISVSIKSKKFFYLAAASRGYGFTTGTNNTKTIDLTPLGRKAVFPENTMQEREALERAFFNVDIFKHVNEYYKEGGLPQNTKYLYNTLQEKFNIPSEYHEEFYKIYTANIKFLNSKEITIDYISSQQDNNPISENVASNDKQITSSNSSKELFVIMPFTEKTEAYPDGFFDEVFSSLIVPAAVGAGFNPKTANQSGSDIIHKTIVSGIYNAEIILADLTEHNPNVLFELGLAIAFKKKVAIIRAKGTKAIFDVDNSIRVLDYSPNLWKSTLEMDIEKLSKHIMTASESDSSCYLDIFLS